MRQSSFLFIIFALSTKNLTSFWRKVFKIFVKTAFYVLREPFWWFFFRKKNFSSKLEFFCKSFSLFSRKFSGKLLKSSIWVSRGTFWWKIVFSHFIKKNADLWEEDFGGFVKMHSTCQGERFEEFLPEKKKLFLVLKSDRENFGLLSNRQPAGLSKLIFTSTKERFDGFFWRNKSSIRLFRLLSAKFIQLSRESFSRAAKTAFNVSSGTFRWQIIFSKEQQLPSFLYFERKNFGLLAIKFRQACQNCNLGV